MGDINIPGLFFADDMVLVGKSELEMHEHLRMLSKFAVSTNWRSIAGKPKL